MALFRVVVAGIVKDADKVLVAQRKRSDTSALLWEFPGGEVNAGEDARSALRRELIEELNIEVNVEKIYDILPVPQTNIMIVFFICQIQKGQPQSCDCNDFKWVPVNEITKLELCKTDAVIAARLAESCRH